MKPTTLYTHTLTFLGILTSGISALPTSARSQDQDLNTIINTVVDECPTCVSGSPRSAEAEDIGIQTLREDVIVTPTEPRSALSDWKPRSAKALSDWHVTPHKDEDEDADAYIKRAIEAVTDHCMERPLARNAR